MKKILLLLCALLFAAPACAGDVAEATSAPASARATDAAPGNLTAATLSPATTIVKTVAQELMGKDAHAAACPMQCKTMNCPPPNGMIMVCCPVAPYTQTCP